MRENEYGEAAVEVLDILNYMDKEDIKRIPQSFINFLRDISNKNYRPQFNHEQAVNKLNLKKQTKELLGFIYITWWCDNEEREQYKKQFKNENIKKSVAMATYNADDIFKNKQSKIKENVEETSLVEYKEDNLFKKFIKKILSFFNK